LNGFRSPVNSGLKLLLNGGESIMKIQPKLFALLTASLLLLASVGDARAKDTQLKDKDKAQIIKSILLEIDFLNRGLRVGEKKDVVYLSTANISPQLVPEIPGASLALLGPEEVEEKSKTGLGYYEFGEFKVKGSKVMVSFGHTWRSDRGRVISYQMTHYEYRKVSGMWRGKRVKTSIGMS
jgi:predicted nuclease of predicted toxin-antitoxin system